MKYFKKAISIFLICCVLFLTGCDGKNKPISNLAEPGQADTSDITEDKARQEAFAKSTPENDTDTGLKNIKIDTAEQKLTDEQKLVISYFDTDYFDEFNYEFLRRYPQVFDGTQLYIYGTVVKVLSQTQDSYSLVLQIGSLKSDGPSNEYLVINGKTSDTLFMDNDEIIVYARYNGVDTFSIDGKSYTVPKLTVHKAFFAKSDKFTATDIKKIARTVFGDNTEVRLPIRGKEIPEGFHESVYNSIYLAELENQSNAKFSKYFFDGINGGDITVATEAYGEEASSIERHVEFSADFKHFFLFTYDWSLETMTLEYYDQNYNKLWKREFEEIAPPKTEGDMTRVYDYTKNNIYLVANNELYIINTETGEDTYEPKFVGDKIDVRKLDDGILLISYNKSDGIMKLGLDGSIIWKTNVADNIINSFGMQLVNDTIVLKLDMSDYHYLVLNKKTGEIKVDAMSQ